MYTILSVKRKRRVPSARNEEVYACDRGPAAMTSLPPHRSSGVTCGSSRDTNLFLNVKKLHVGLMTSQSSADSRSLAPHSGFSGRLLLPLDSVSVGDQRLSETRFISSISPGDETRAEEESLHLDRRRLLEVPHIYGGETLRLLNLQHNLISHLQHLSHLQLLEVLRLQHNRLEDMRGFSGLKRLRVLMLGHNRIERIEGLDSLTQLEFLDLQSNQISQIENLSCLSNLRVLNLSRNQISRVENLRNLISLTQLDLRQNHISSLTDVESLPRLQHLLLSFNRISRWDELLRLRECVCLAELSVEGNPVALPSCYKHTLLRHLHMKRLGDEDRRTAGVCTRKEDEKKKESHKSAHKERRRLAIQNAALLWEGLKGAKEEVSPDNSPAHSPLQTNGNAAETSPDEPRRSSPGVRPAGRPHSPRDARSHESLGVQTMWVSDSHLAELEGETLHLFGPGALEMLERCWGVQTAAAVTSLTFHYIHFDSITPCFLRIRLRFPNLTHLVFMETGICHLPQLAALAQLRRLDQISLHPDGNPVLGLKLWRLFLIYRLQQLNLQKINGIEVTVNDIIASERMFGALGHVAAIETPRCRLLLLLEESRKRQLQFLLEGRGRRSVRSPEDLKESRTHLEDSWSRALFNYPSKVSHNPEAGRSAAVQQYLQVLIREASGLSAKGDALQKLWPSLFSELVRDCVLEMRDPQLFRQTRLRRFTLS